MITLRQLIDYTNGNDLTKITGVIRNQEDIISCLLFMAEDRHEEQSNYLNGIEHHYISQAQIDDYAEQLREWLFGETEVRPIWTTYPIKNSLNAPSEIMKAASWVVWPTMT